METVATCAAIAAAVAVGMCTIMVAGAFMIGGVDGAKEMVNIVRGAPLDPAHA